MLADTVLGTVAHYARLSTLAHGGESRRRDRNAWPKGTMTPHGKLVMRNLISESIPAKVREIGVKRQRLDEIGIILERYIIPAEM